jgi:hypothetical protein
MPSTGRLKEQKQKQKKWEGIGLKTLNAERRILKKQGVMAWVATSVKVLAALEDANWIWQRSGKASRPSTVL